MIHPIDILNWFGCRQNIKWPGKIMLRASLAIGLPRLLRLAGRRTVSGSALAPAIILTSGDIEKALKDPELLYRAMVFTVTEMHMDAFCTVAELSLEAEACGCQIQFHQRDMPSVITHPVRNKEDMSKLNIPNPEHDGRMPIILYTLERLKRNYSMIKVATATGPFTLSLQLCGSTLYADTLKNPEKVDAVMVYSAKVVTTYTKALIKHGADMIVIAEPAISQLSPRLYERFAHSIIDAIAKGSTKPFMLHVCGKAEHLVEYMCKSNYKAFSVDEVDMTNLGKKLPHNSVAVGNVSPLLLRHGTTADIEKKTLTLLNDTVGKREIIVAPGCDLAPDTPLANILTFVKTTKNWKRG